jgi:hypothetical protein
MDELHRVTFRFAGSTEIHYLADLPEAGDFVSHGTELWEVSRVETDAVGALVICQRPPSSNGPSSRGSVESFA